MLTQVVNLPTKYLVDSLKEIASEEGRMQAVERFDRQMK